MMRVSAPAVNMVAHYEQGPNGGFASTPYLCPAGKKTLGYGHVLLPFEQFDYPIDQAQADSLLANDLTKAMLAVMPAVTVQLTQGQFDALASFTFNVGDNAFRTSTLLKYVNGSRFQLAAAEFGRWVFGGGKLLPGLVRRRNAESHLFLTGDAVIF